MISAKIIADSKNEFGQRLTTFVLTFPRIVLAEFNTHRIFSRNSASSRAIPFKKMLKMVQEDPFIPIKWMKDHKGMQGNDFVTNEKVISLRIGQWLKARDSAIHHAEELSSDVVVQRAFPDEMALAEDGEGITKQIVNRLLEPFMWHTVILTTSEIENWFALRAHEAAEIHIAALAETMLNQYNIHAPKQLKAGEWHIPFGDTFDSQRLDDITMTHTIPVIDVKVRIATARCARVSYLNFEGKDDYEADIKLHDRLLESGHNSPFEHCARAMNQDEYNYWNSGFSELNDMEHVKGWCGNFRGFIQYRKMIQGENKSDNRVKK